MDTKYQYKLFQRPIANGGGGSQISPEKPERPERPEREKPTAEKVADAVRGTVGRYAKDAEAIARGDFERISPEFKDAVRDSIRDKIQNRTEFHISITDRATVKVGKENDSVFVGFEYRF